MPKRVARTSWGAAGVAAVLVLGTAASAAAVTEVQPEGPITMSTGLGPVTPLPDGSGFLRYNSVAGNIIDVDGQRDRHLESAQFYLHNSVEGYGDISYRAIVMEWNDETKSPIGEPLFESEPRKLPVVSENQAYERVVFDMGGIALDEGTRYFLGLTTALDDNPAVSSDFLLRLGHVRGGEAYRSQLVANRAQLTDPTRWAGVFAGEGPPLAVNLRFDGEPVATSATPSRGEVNIAHEVLLAGENLSGVAEVTAGGVAVPFEILSDTSIAVTVTPSVVGEVPIIVTNRYGSSGEVIFTATEPAVTVTVEDAELVYGQPVSLVADVQRAQGDWSVVFGVGGTEYPATAVAGSTATVDLPARAFEVGAHEFTATVIEEGVPGVGIAAGVLSGGVTASGTMTVAAAATDIEVTRSPEGITGVVRAAYDSVPTGLVVMLDSRGEVVAEAAVQEGRFGFAASVRVPAQATLAYAGDRNHRESTVAVPAGAVVPSPGPELATTGADGTPAIVAAALAALAVLSGLGLIGARRLRGR